MIYDIIKSASPTHLQNAFIGFGVVVEWVLVVLLLSRTPTGGVDVTFGPARRRISPCKKSILISEFAEKCGKMELRNIRRNMNLFSNGKN